MIGPEVNSFYLHIFMIFKIHIMMGPEVNSLYLHILMIFEIQLLQDIMSCMAGDALVEL